MCLVRSMKIQPIALALTNLLLLLSLGSTAVFADVALPTPPDTNPYPPTSYADKARVEVALMAVEKTLSSVPGTQWLANGNKNKPLLDKDLSCFQSPVCWKQDLAFASNVTELTTQRGAVIELRHAHVMPWTIRRFQKRPAASGITTPKFKAKRAKPVINAPKLKADEFMVHIYARFERGTWHHLDVIMTEDAQGKPAVRYFFTTPMRASLPPGVKC